MQNRLDIGIVYEEADCIHLIVNLVSGYWQTLNLTTKDNYFWQRNQRSNYPFNIVKKSLLSYLYEKHKSD